jgi:hypothetical protein
LRRRRCGKANNFYNGFLDIKLATFDNKFLVVV